MLSGFLTPYELKSCRRLAGVARSLGFKIKNALWNPSTHTATVELEGEAARFIEAASFAIRKARYTYVPGGVAIQFIPTAKRTQPGKQI